VDYLLARGCQIDGFLAFVMSEAPLGKFENYLFTSPPLFLPVTKLETWEAAQNSKAFPNLKYLTNFGTISVANNARFGSDTTNGYVSMVNHGDIISASPVIRAAQFENSGLISSDGPIGLTATVAKLDTGQFAANGDVSIAAGDVKFNSHSIRTLGALILNVSGALTDSGGDANNNWSVENGFRLPVKPATGDLLGTSLSSTAPRFGNVLHTWAAEDRG
jgi:hypothetical protein